MNTWKAIKFTLALAALVMVVTWVPGTQADTWNKKTIITLSEPVEFPTGVVLQPGKYVMKLVDSQSNRHIVQVLNEEENHVHTTLIAIPNWRVQPTGKTVITFHEMPAGQNKAIKAWFYPGDNFGQEFAFPEARATQIAAVTQTEVVRLSAEDEAAMTARTEVREEPQVARVEPAPVEPAPAQPAEPPSNGEPAVTPEPPASPEPQAAPAEPAPEREALPETASNLPLLGLMGLISACAALGLRTASKLLG